MCRFFCFYNLSANIRHRWLTDGKRDVNCIQSKIPELDSQAKKIDKILDGIWDQTHALSNKNHEVWVPQHISIGNTQPWTMQHEILVLRKRRMSQLRVS